MFFSHPQHFSPCVAFFYICLHPGQISRVQNQVLSHFPRGILESSQIQTLHCTVPWPSLYDSLYFTTIMPATTGTNLCVVDSLLLNAGKRSRQGTLVLAHTFPQNIFGFHFFSLSFLYRFQDLEPRKSVAPLFVSAPLLVHTVLILVFSNYAWFFIFVKNLFIFFFCVLE